ncbi:uncharacterized protein LOC110831513 isoform X3 [Zootermopsis nevadensis]|uniref:uncharacterized protein LOC110831513 isoform X3 n=1 Tax=Zootermopsis nevadensis TaxID=136037 RepID=UPI000B8E7FCF|nr:uncharacterized protein LOC110831513 isoform X3 [Zootermopsis nevadensis]
MLLWMSLYLSVVILPQYEFMNCDSTEYPNDDYTRKRCKPHEGPAAKGFCAVYPTLYVKDLEAGIVVAEFNVLSRSCNVSSYEFRFEVDENLNETNCRSKFFKGIEHSAKRVVLITHDETVQSCGKIQNVTFEYVYEGCYRLSYIHEVDNTLVRKFIIQYMRTTYKKEESPCDETYITPNYVKRNSIDILMTNFSKFDVIYSTVTKPEGSFACDDKTDLKRFMWVMTYDHGHNIECTIHNIAPGNYCYYVIMPYVYCNPLSNKRGLYQKFNVPEEPVLGKAQEATPDNTIILVVVFLFLVAVGFIVVIVIWKGKTRSLHEIYFHVEECPPLPRKSKILLLYCRDCEHFMEMMITLREMLKEMTECEVYDCFDPVLGEEVGRSKIDWIRRHVSSDEVNIVVVESSVAVMHQQALLRHSKVCYREPTWLDELFLYGLKSLTDDVKRNTYQHVFVVRIDGFTGEKDFLKYLPPYRRYVVPQHLRLLRDDLCLQSKLNIVPCLDRTDGNLQKFEQEIKNLTNYKKQDPDYLDELILSAI